MLQSQCGCYERCNGGKQCGERKRSKRNLVEGRKGRDGNWKKEGERREIKGAGFSGAEQSVMNYNSVQQSTVEEGCTGVRQKAM